MEGEMQPADEGPCAPKMCRQLRGPYSTLKPFQSKRSAGKSRFDRSAVQEGPDIHLSGNGIPWLPATLLQRFGAQVISGLHLRYQHRWV
ncbi:hypothetical protein XENOCAPTIV_002288 [Xenoophorus captivus]|uniref:Uncharacterized protein n=1 Tax=Xenoophorus captivus TaxID=1517983 RepID=A0ABV0S9V1_9TELE